MQRRKAALRSVSSSPPAPDPSPQQTDLKKIHRLMAQARALEERLILMNRGGEGYFWIGGPGEEAFNVPLGLLVKKGQGPSYDYLHFHYRNAATMLAMGMPMIDAIRQMACKATDPFSGGRYFVNHFAKWEWNVVPVTSAIEVQYAMAPGSAMAQKRHGGDGITIVTGGDAGTAEGDFSTCLNWSSLPGREVPLLMIITNNRWGISTPYEEVHSEEVLARRAEPFGIRWDTVDGNDPLASWRKLSEAMGYVRKERRPFCLEAHVSRLHGHSSASGAKRTHAEPDCLADFEKRLIGEKLLTAAECREIRKGYEREALEALRQVRGEPDPQPSSIHDHTYREAD